MAKITQAVDAIFDGKTDTLKANVKTADGQTLTLEFDALAWAHLIGLATIEQSVFQQIDLTKPASWVVVTGMKAGVQSERRTFIWHHFSS